MSDWIKQIQDWLMQLRRGLHRFSCLIQYRFKDGCVRVWSFLDRLMIHLLIMILRPTFKHVISPVCLHLKGPSAVKGITQQVKAALLTGHFHHVLRLDMKSYYASIDHRILVDQVKNTYDDPVMQHYLEAIITAGIDCDGIIKLPTTGIPCGSALSPFFGALYLKPLDQAFENKENCLYLRYMDDILILVKTKRQYQRAKKQVFKILRELRLKLSPHKTRMGKIDKGFHYIVLSSEVSWYSLLEWHVLENTMNLLESDERFASSEVRPICSHEPEKQSKKTSAVHPANIQCYLTRWAIWWSSATGKRSQALINQWVNYTEDIQADLSWIGSGLLLGIPWNVLNRSVNNTSS